MRTIAPPVSHLIRRDGGHAPENLAVLHRAVLGLLKNETAFKAGLKHKRRRCAMVPDYLFQVLATAKN